jgi:predicted Fe-Mo cluster-binding NifX family protein
VFCKILSKTTVNIAIPQWRGRVSPVFDSACQVLLVEILEGGHVRREMLSIAEDDPLERARSLQRFGVQLLICGAISRPMEMALAAAGIEVIPNTCGQVEDVLNAFLTGRLNEKAFLMPGTSRWKVDGTGDSTPGL